MHVSLSIVLLSRKKCLAVTSAYFGNIVFSDKLQTSIWAVPCSGSPQLTDPHERSPGALTGFVNII